MRSEGFPEFLVSEEESGIEVVPENSPGCHASLKKDMEISKIIRAKLLKISDNK